jgi:hypothetical protein
VSVWYLDIDDEITDAVARLRAATDERVVLVVPPGSRVATGRINFRLLAREAKTRRLALAIASPDAQVRALAVAAGLPAHAVPADAEQALERGETAPVAQAEPGRRSEAEAADGPGTAPGAQPRDEVETLVPTIIFPPGEDDDQAAGGGRGRRTRLGLAAGLVVGIVAIGSVATFTVLPTASITLRPLTSPVGPLTVEVTADPAIDVVDAAALRVPAERVEFPLSVTATFAASGRETTETRATGEVTFSGAPTFNLEIAAGTRLRTEEGVEFATREPVFLEVPTNGVAEVRAGIEAVTPGESGNVEAGAITQLPPVFQEQRISVTNPEPTGGGSSEVSPVITQEDYDAAAVDMQNRLAGRLAQRLADPSAVPEGLTLFPETAQRGEVRIRPPAAELVGQHVGELELLAEASASALAVDEALVARLASDRLGASAPDGYAVVPASVVVVPGEGLARQGVVRYQPTAEGRAVALVVADEVVDAIIGLPITDARSILDAYGTSQVEIWPEFVGRMPDDPERITLTVVDPEAGSE